MKSYNETCKDANASPLERENALLAEHNQLLRELDMMRMSDAERANKHLLRVLAWQELAIWFLNEYNPRPERAVVIAHAILEWDGETSHLNMRHHAHCFVERAYRIIELGQVLETTEDHHPAMLAWITDWTKKNLTR